MSDLIQGLQVSGLGIFITFLALGVFILIMVVLQRLFPVQPQTGDRKQVAKDGEKVGEAAYVTTANDAETAATIAAAVQVLRVRQHGGGATNARGSLGASLSEGRSAWWAARRQEANQRKR